MSAWKKGVFWTLALLPVLLIAAYFIGRMWLHAYLRSEDFRRFVSRRTAVTFQADGEFAALHFSGLNVHSDGFKARGSERAGFSALAIEQIRAELSLRRWSERVWQIENVEAQRVDLQIDGSRIALAPTIESESAKTRNPGGGWLPNRVEIGSARVREANVAWGDPIKTAGSLRGVNLAATQRDDAWDITGNGGRIEQAGLPALDIGALRLRYKEPALFVQSAELRQGAGGTITADGEVRFGERLDLQAKLAGIDLTPLLSSDWRVRLRGKIGGEVRVQTVLPAANAPLISGVLRLSEGQLEALPVLDEIALFTGLQQYRRLPLSRASADFQHENGTLRATNFIAESDGLIRMEGGFTVANGVIDGTFQVGVTPASLQWLPGSQARVFTETRGAYLWAPMRLAGPLDKPREDLSPRLAAAAKDAVIEKVGSTVIEATKTGKDAIKGALDSLMPLIK